MPWKIVNLDHDCSRPHLHLKDPARLIHLRTFFDGEGLVEVAVGAESVGECRIRAYVTPADVRVDATEFTLEDLQIIDSVLASLDVVAEDRRAAIEWTTGRKVGEGGFYAGNLARFAPVKASNWPHDLEDDALLEAYKDSARTPGARRNMLWNEIESRRLGDLTNQLRG